MDESHGSELPVTGVPESFGNDQAGGERHPVRRPRSKVKNQTIRKSTARILTALHVTAVYLMSVVIVVPTVVVTCGCLLSLLPLIILWAIADRLFRLVRHIWRNICVGRFIRTASQLASEVMDNRRSLSAAAACFSERTIFLLDAHTLIGPLIKSASPIGLTNRGNLPTIRCRLIAALADRHMNLEDQKRCRCLLVEHLSSAEVRPEIRASCEDFLARDRDRSPHLFAAAQTKKAELLAKRDAVLTSSLQIEALELALSGLTPREHFEQWVEAKNMLGVAFWNQWRSGKDAANVALAIKSCQECLQFLNEDAHPTRWALAHYNLGVFYSYRISESHQDDIEAIVQSMGNALRVYEPGMSTYVDAQIRLMTALSRRAKGVHSVNLDRAISCIHGALSDRNRTKEQNDILHNSLRILLERRWGPSVSCLVETRHREIAEQFLSKVTEPPLTTLRSQFCRVEPFERKRRILLVLKWLGLALSLVLAIALWHKPLLLWSSYVALSGVCVAVVASFAAEGIEKLTMIPLDWIRVIPVSCWWFATSKEPVKGRVAGALMSLFSKPRLGVSKVEELWRAISKEKYPTVWAVAGSIFAWSSLMFGEGDPGETIHNAIAVLQEAGKIFTDKRFGAFQSGVDYSLAKAYLMAAERGRKEYVDSAITLISEHLMPVRLIGSQKRSGLMWSMGLQLLGDAYMRLAANSGPGATEQAIQCYVESLGTRSMMPRRSRRIVGDAVAIARMRPTRRMRAHALRGIGEGLLSLPEDASDNRRSSGVACLVNAYSIFDQPSILHTLGAIASPKEPSIPFESIQAAESKLTVLVLIARSLMADSIAQQENIPEAVLRVCAFDALQSGMNEIAYVALMDLGKLLSQNDRLEEAVGAYEIAIRHVEASRRMARVIERRAEILRHNTEAFDRIIAILVRLGRLSSALGYVERGKSLSVSDFVSLGRESRNPRGDPKIEGFADLQVTASILSHKLRSSAESIGTVSAMGSWNRKYTNKHRQEFYKATEGLLQLAGDVECMPSEIDTQLIGPRGIQQFGERTRVAFVFFRVGDDATHAFVLTPHSLRVVRSEHVTNDMLYLAIGLSSDDTIAWSWPRKDPRSSWKAQMADTLHALGDHLMKKVTTVLREQRGLEGHDSFDRVVLIPSRALAILPLHACWWMENGVPSCILNDFPINFVPSVSIYKHCVEHAGGLGSKPSCVGLFNPAPPGDLEFASWEYFQLRSILSGWDQTFRSGRDATRDVVLRDGQHANILHFSCHGTYLIDSPFLSPLQLARGDTLTLEQILRQLRLGDSRLVVLSACKSGLVHPKDPADEHFGLPTAFLFSGASTVWATFWSVDDLATAILTVRAYENLIRKDVDSSQALRDAQLWIRNATGAELAEILGKSIEETASFPGLYQQINNERERFLKSPESKPFTHPYYWAAFHTVGA